MSPEEAQALDVLAAHGWQIQRGETFGVLHDHFGGVVVNTYPPHPDNARAYAATTARQPWQPLSEEPQNAGALYARTREKESP